MASNKGQFEWEDYDLFQNQLEFYLEKGRREFDYSDFFSTKFPSKAEYKKFDDIFKMAITGIGGYIQSIRKCPADEHKSIYVVTFLPQPW